MDLNDIQKPESRLWTAPQKLDIKSNDWGAIFMKLSYEDKVQIYELRKKDKTATAYQVLNFVL